ncbi:uncharacterized protein LOC144093830 [Amblyomma americanum]
MPPTSCAEKKTLEGARARKDTGPTPWAGLLQPRTFHAPNGETLAARSGTMRVRTVYEQEMPLRTARAAGLPSSSVRDAAQGCGTKMGGGCGGGATGRRDAVQHGAGCGACLRGAKGATAPKRERQHLEMSLTSGSFEGILGTLPPKVSEFPCSISVQTRVDCESPSVVVFRFPGTRCNKGVPCQHISVFIFRRFVLLGIKKLLSFLASVFILFTYIPFSTRR